MRRAARTDATQDDIVKALRQVGAKVDVVGGAVDLLVLFQGDIYRIDAKTAKSKKGRIEKTLRQQKLEAEGWPVHYATTPAEALAVLGIS